MPQKRLYYFGFAETLHNNFSSFKKKVHLFDLIIVKWLFDRRQTAKVKVFRNGPVRWLFMTLYDLFIREDMKQNQDLYEPVTVQSLEDCRGTPAREHKHGYSVSCGICCHVFLMRIWDCWTMPTWFKSHMYFHMFQLFTTSLIVSLKDDCSEKRCHVPCIHYIIHVLLLFLVTSDPFLFIRPEICTHTAKWTLTICILL